MRALSLLLALAPATLAAACGGAVSDPGGTPPGQLLPDAGPSSEDAGEVDAEPPLPYPAFATIDAPQVVTFGGPVLKTPRVRNVYFPGFPYGKEMTEFASKIGATSYWKPMSEYKVGPIEADPPIELTEGAPNTIDDTEIQAWLASRFDGTHPEWPKFPDTDTIYTLFYPQGVNITLGGSQGGEVSCQNFGGYHNDVLVGSDLVAYAVIPDCGSFGSLQGLDAITTTTSHELEEAVTDPFPSDKPAYATVDSNHTIWATFLGGGEVNDLCAQFATSNYKPADFPFIVQRAWSNKAARTGHNPCQPVADPGEVYFNTVPIFPDKVLAPRTGGYTKGVKVPVGETRTIELDLYSDGPTTGPWTISAQVFAKGSGGGAPFTFAYDKTQGRNGDKIQMSITAKSALTTQTKSTTLMIYSQLGQTRRIWLGVVGN